MVADSAQSMSVSWSPYGKILQTNKAGGASLAFGYNAMQQRVIKRVAQNGDTTRTYYIRDAQGNTMGVYTRHNDSVSWREQYIFGSSRLGLYRADTLVNKGLKLIEKLYEGKRNYELTNHLGNVMAVINDRKADTTIGVNKGYNAVVISATDYYPFGMAIDSRSYTSSLYRYGFNGKELDKETGEEDYGARMYSIWGNRFLSIDPIASKYPELSPYQFASNRPIDGVDLNGLEYLSKEESFYEIKNGNVFIKEETAKMIGMKIAYASGKDANGKDWIGTNLVIGFLDLKKIESPLSPNYSLAQSKESFYNNEFNLDGRFDYTPGTDAGQLRPKDMPGARSNYTKGILNPEGNYDQRQTNRQSSWESAMRGDAFSAPAFRMAGYAGLAIEIFRLGKTLRDNSIARGNSVILERQNSILNKVIGDLQIGLSNGLIPPKFQNLDKLSQIGNYLLQGTASDPEVVKFTSRFLIPQLALIKIKEILTPTTKK